MYFGLRGAYAYNLPQMGAIVGQLWAIVKSGAYFNIYVSTIFDYRLLSTIGD
jgi:hypothetical protein